MKKIFFSFFALLVILTACGNQVSDGTTISGARTDIIETDEGKVEVTTVSTGAASWCPAGGEWKYSADVEQGSVKGQWEVIGLETSGQYKGLCHVKYKVESNQGMADIEYWFREGGESGYMQMDVNGQKITQEWNK